MKKIVILIVVATAIVGAWARPCGPGGWHPGPAPHHYYDHHSGWGHAGENFWPGFVGGLVGGVVGSAVANTVATPPPVVVTQPTVVAQPVVVAQPTVVAQPVVTQTVVTQPVTTTQNVWVEGRYVDTVQANGTVIRTWQPGHYETRTVVVR